MIDRPIEDQQTKKESVSKNPFDLDSATFELENLSSLGVEKLKFYKDVLYNNILMVIGRTNSSLGEQITYEDPRINNLIAGHENVIILKEGQEEILSKMMDIVEIIQSVRTFKGDKDQRGKTLPNSKDELIRILQDAKDQRISEEIAVKKAEKAEKAKLPLKNKKKKTKTKKTKKVPYISKADREEEEAGFNRNTEFSDFSKKVDENFSKLQEKAEILKEEKKKQIMAIIADIDLVTENITDPVENLAKNQLYTEKKQDYRRQISVENFFKSEEDLVDFFCKLPEGWKIDVKNIIGANGRYLIINLPDKKKVIALSFQKGNSSWAGDEGYFSRVLAEKTRLINIAINYINKQGDGNEDSLVHSVNKQELADKLPNIKAAKNTNELFDRVKKSTDFNDLDSIYEDYKFSDFPIKNGVIKGWTQDFIFENGVTARVFSNRIRESKLEEFNIFENSSHALLNQNELKYVLEILFAEDFNESGLSIE